MCLFTDWNVKWKPIRQWLTTNNMQFSPGGQAIGSSGDNVDTGYVQGAGDAGNSARGNPWWYTNVG